MRDAPPTQADLSSAVLQSLPDAVLVVDANGVIRMCNAAVERLLQYPPRALLGTPVDALLPADARVAHAERRHKYVKDPRVRVMGQGLDLFAVTADGAHVPVDIALGPVQGLPGHVCAVLRDATLSFLDRRRLRREADCDPLTSLENRRSGERRLGEALVAAEGRDERLSVVVIDVGRFKSVNDQFGHLAGDEALVALADAIRNTVRSTDVCARFGGDEFVVGLVGASPRATAAIIRDLHRAISDIRLPNGERLTAACGAASYPEDGTSIQALLAAADRAMYAVKRGDQSSSVQSASD